VRRGAPVAPGILPALAVDRTGGKPLHRQICDAFREAIVEHRLRSAQRLPSTRTLAGALAVSRLPVLNAYEQLLAEGYLESRVGSGTFVSSTIPTSRAPSSDPPPAPGGDGRAPGRSPVILPPSSARRSRGSRASAHSA
jgi:GntR family transcriptional regulator / MocR family aminotransferase